MPANAYRIGVVRQDVCSAGDERRLRGSEVLSSPHAVRDFLHPGSLAWSMRCSRCWLDAQHE